MSAAYPIASGNSKQSNPDGSQQVASGAPQSRQAAEDARKDRTLAEFMLMLDDYEPLVYHLAFYDHVQVVTGNHFRSRTK